MRIYVRTFKARPGLEKRSFSRAGHQRTPVLPDRVWENGGSPGPCLGKRSFSGVSTTLLSQVTMSTFLCFTELLNQRNAAINAAREKQIDEWKAANRGLPMGFPPFCIPLLYPPRPGLAWPSDRIPGTIHITSSNQHVSQ